MKLVIKKISTEEDFNNYLNFIESFDVINPFYKILVANQHEFIDEKLCYFLFFNENEKLIILMPFLIRKIPYDNQLEQYFDVISPYGYSGPLFNYSLSRAYLIHFWLAVDNWYRENNVVSEFIRFSLNNNHQFYSGSLSPTLSNVRGLILNENDQWNNFKQKVRNNYRKSTSNNLKIHIAYKNIADSEVELFHDIYIKTMNRINASEDYFYSLNYFKNIIKLSKNKCLIAFVYFEGQAISTELVLISGNTLFSYLGGTLSDYFNFRPNDFLKIEVMKWARQNNKKYYILGGGREDNDSLYQYKKTFFPNDEDVIYYTGRKIVNKEIYDSLTEVFNKNNSLKKPKLSNYFPSYRQGKETFKKLT